MSKAEERLLEWLRDAHAMEEQAETMLDGLARRLEHYPELRERVEGHLEETRHQADRLEGCIKRRGGSTSLLKTATGKMMGLGQAISGIFVGDEVVKGSMASYTFEHMEIAAYKILIAAAEQVGDVETRTACESILREEEAMAEWLGDNLESVVHQYLRREEVAPEIAKS
jgi:ferritin-like metal-binding protein YciE